MDMSHADDFCLFPAADPAMMYLWQIYQGIPNLVERDSKAHHEQETKVLFPRYEYTMKMLLTKMSQILLKRTKTKCGGQIKMSC
jgi:hypothetical protein